MKLTSKERNFLRALAHDLKPVVRIGKNGITEELYTSINQVLSTHELIKIKLLNNTEVEMERKLLEEIEEKTKSYVISTIGSNIIVFKPKYVNNKPGKITAKFNEFRNK